MLITGEGLRRAASGWDWWQFLNDSTSALIGGVVGGLAGGGIAAWVAIRQTRETLKHQADLAREATAEERAAYRAQFVHSACLELLSVLARLRTELRKVPGARSPMGGREAEEGRDFLEMLTVATEGPASLLPSTARARWKQFVELVEAYSGLRGLHLKLNQQTGVTELPTGAELDAQLAEGRVLPEDYERAQRDVYAYGDYVRRTLLAVIDGTSLPPEHLPPVLNRRDGATWSWSERDL